AAVRHVQAAEDVHHRRLARARRSHERDELTRTHVEVGATQGLDDVVLAHPIRLRDSAKADDRAWNARDLAAHRVTICCGAAPPPPICTPRPPQPAPDAVARGCGRTTTSPSCTPV